MDPQGRKLIALSQALNLFADTEEFQLKKKKAPEQDTTDVPYAELERHAISEITTGSIFEADLDKTHPLSFGIERYYTLKLDADAYDLLENEGNALILNSEVKPIAGFIGQQVKELQKKSLLFGEESWEEVVSFISLTTFFSEGSGTVANSCFLMQFSFRKIQI